MKQSHKTLLLWILMVLMFVAIYQVFSPRDAASENIAYSDFITYAADGQIDAVTIRGEEIRGIYRESKRPFATRGPTAPRRCRRSPMATCR